LDEAFENMYRSTKGDNYNWIRSESLYSLEKHLLKRMKDVYMEAGAEGYLKHKNANNKPVLYEEFSQGMITKGVYCEFENELCYSKQIFINDTLREKHIYMLGVPSDVDIYTYYDNAYLNEIKRYRGDSIKFGRWMGFYDNGQKKYIGSYLNGKRTGKWKYWDEEGNKSMIQFVEGEAVN
jgi:antitoxin component YwqK of YwqJK toxin-antitoxin module